MRLSERDGVIRFRDQSYVPSLGLSGTRTNISETKSFLYKRNWLKKILIGLERCFSVN